METWGGETVIVTCPECGMTIHKAKTQGPSAVYCRCGKFKVTARDYQVNTEQGIYPLKGEGQL